MRNLLLLCALAACGSDDPAPSATIASFSPDSLTVANDFADDLTLVVDYADGDADLGGGTAEVHDCRAADVVTLLELPPIASEEAIRERVPITGSLSLIVSDVGLVTPAGSAPAVCRDLGAPDPTLDSAVFCVLLTDAAGHTGPGDCTAAIAIQ